ncbi:MAG: 30S ribosome-binding factor RbfA [Mycoplasma sp.]|nr:30S ribosome-binding factor RbfA [Mycoplasma sp.]
MDINTKRLASTYFRVIAKIIKEEIKDSNLSLANVTDVVLSKDRKNLNVYVRFISQPNKSIKKLNLLKPLFQSRLSKALNIYKSPHILFKLDTTFEKAQKIEDILEKLEKENKI